MTTVSGIMDGVVFCDARGHVTLLNPTGESLTGLRAFMVIGHALADNVGSGELVDAVIEDHAKALEVDKSTRVVEVHHGAHDLAYIRVESACVRNHAGDFAGVLSVLQDVTDEHKNDQAKNQYLSIVAHELRTPLTGIKTFSTMLSKGTLGDLNDKQQHVADSIREQSLRLEHQIDKLINIGYLDSADYGQDPETFEVAEFLAQAVAPFERVAEETGVEFVLDGDDRSMIRADRTDLRRATQALIENAVKFAPQGQSVRVGARSVGDDVEIFVADTGIGIDPRYQRRIFEKFFQVEDPLTRHHGGAGLGLFVARGIVEAHGSRITVQSALGEGAVFAFRLPIHSEAELPSSAMVGSASSDNASV